MDCCYIPGNNCCGTASTNALWWCYKIQMQITRLPITPNLLTKEKNNLFETETPRKAIFFPLVSKNISLLHSKMRSSLTNYITSFMESQDPSMVWVRRDIKVDLAPSPCHGQGLD